MVVGVSKPRAIIRAFREKELPEPNIRKLSTYLASIRTKQGQPIVSLTDLDKVCKERSAWPEDVDTPFIVNHMITIDENGDNENNRFRYFISTKRLLSQMNISGSIHVDATYKLMWQGFPVLVVGTSDKYRAFHPYGIAVTHSEAEEDFEFVFRTLHEAYGRLFDGQEYLPTVHIADCAEAITNGCVKVLPNIIRVYCWAHVIRNADKKLTSLVRNGLQRAEIRKDIKILQLSKSDSEFLRASELWFRKWNLDDTCEFASYFKDEYITKHMGWHEGRAPGYPSTNNCLEATNNIIKLEWTLRNRLSIRDFLDIAFKRIQDWSTERDQNCINFKQFAIIQIQYQSQHCIILFR